MKCSHGNVEVHDYRPQVSGIGIRCAECHAVMVKNAKGREWHRRNKWNSIPVDRKYFKAFIMPPPTDRMEGYRNIHMVRR